MSSRFPFWVKAIIAESQGMWTRSDLSNGVNQKKGKVCRIFLPPYETLQHPYTPQNPWIRSGVRFVKRSEPEKVKVYPFLLDTKHYSTFTPPKSLNFPMTQILPEKVKRFCVIFLIFQGPTKEPRRTHLNAPDYPRCYRKSTCPLDSHFGSRPSLLSPRECGRGQICQTEWTRES